MKKVDCHHINSRLAERLAKRPSGLIFIPFVNQRPQPLKAWLKGNF